MECTSAVFWVCLVGPLETIVGEIERRHGLVSPPEVRKRLDLPSCHVTKCCRERLKRRPKTKSTEERSMGMHRCGFAVLTLAAAMSIGLAAMAAELPKEGNYKGTYSAIGTYKVNPIDKDRALST